MTPVMTVAELEAFFRQACPDVAEEQHARIDAVEAKAVHADAVLLKLGKRLATVDVRLWQDDESKVLAQATVTYAIPG